MARASSRPSFRFSINPFRGDACSSRARCATTGENTSPDGRTAEYLGRDRFVGIRQEGWLLKAGEASEVQAIVIDTKDEVASGTEVTFRVQYRETTASRVKGAGNAYITQYNHAWVDVATCAAVSAAEPSRCAFTPEKPGYYQISASILDSKNRSYEVSTSRWAAGKGQVLWEESPGHRLDIEPEKKEYRVGETARFLVRNPFPGAKALVTIERYGVQKHWLETFEESTEVIEVQVGEDHVPGFYLSAVVTSPRVEAPPSEDDLDLGKPAFRMGYVQVPVLDPVKEIVVEVHPEKDLYKPRDKVKVELKARPRLWASTALPPDGARGRGPRRGGLRSHRWRRFLLRSLPRLLLARASRRRELQSPDAAHRHPEVREKRREPRW